MTDDIRKPTAVIGVGNSLYGDDGFGAAVVGRLKDESLPEDVDVIDAGAVGIDLLDYLTAYRQVIIVDAARMGLAPGTVKVFRPEEVRSLEAGSPLSLHSTDILGVIELAGALNEPIADVHVVAVEPEYLGPRDSLSQSAERAVPRAVSEVLSAIGGSTE